MTFSDDIMQKTKAWPFEQARALVKRLMIKEKRGNPHTGPVIFQTGYGPSGLPHIGTFGEVARTSMVRQAFNALTDNKYETKLIAFSLGAFWAGLVGVIFAAKTTFVNPASFTFLESAIILSIVVLGGMGSIIGVIIGALILILLPEYLRALSEYRMLAFGAILVVMMVFKPDGIISNVRRNYRFNKQSATEGDSHE